MPSQQKFRLSPIRQPIIPKRCRKSGQKSESKCRPVVRYDARGRLLYDFVMLAQQQLAVKALSG